MVKYNEKLDTMAVGTEKSGTKDFLLGAVVGGVIGAAVALWLSPKSGPALRQEISNQTASLKNKAGSLQTKVSDIAQVTKEKTSSLKQTITQQSQEAMSKLKRNNNPDTHSEETSDLDSIKLMLEETKKAFDETEEKLNH